MATRGRKPLPTAIKLLEGDRGKGRRPINKNEPTPSQENVKCPAWLMPEAKKEWKRLAPALMAMGILTDHDLEAFAGFYRDAEPEDYAVLLCRVRSDSGQPCAALRQYWR